MTGVVALPAVVLASPRPPEEPPPQSFPFISSIAPVIGSVVIWAVTRSPFALMFAFLGPLIAIGSLCDSRLRGRRRARKESVRFASEIDSVRSAIDIRHSEERLERSRTEPGVFGQANATDSPLHWHWHRRDGSAAVLIRLGDGVSSSTLSLEGLPTAMPATSNPFNDELERLRDYAAAISGVPLSVDARLGIGVCGPAVLTESLARGFVLQVAGILSPADTTITTPVSSDPQRAWRCLVDWQSALPHRQILSDSPTAFDLRWVFEQGETQVVIATAEHPSALPRECGIVISAGFGRCAEILRGQVPGQSSALEAEFVSADQAALISTGMAESARSDGLVHRSGEEGWNGDFASLPSEIPNVSDRGTLRAVFSRTPDSPFPIDLVADGPHCVIGGTTGSGKSELLVSWILALAATHSPAMVTFLLVDFKGGSAFEPIRTLPHVVGLVTDLDARRAARAMASLRAEIRFRERALAAIGARGIDHPAAQLPRLVIVVDEFAAMAADFPELHVLFSDLASRGRSLGLHLLLCTQRPLGVIKDSILANAGLRISLRVNSRNDSIAVIGTGAAADLSADRAGVAFVSSGGGVPVAVCVAQASIEDSARIGELWPDHVPLRRPWCEELPGSVSISELAAWPNGSDVPPSSASNFPFALGDFPDRQSQEPVAWDPQADGSLIVVGGQKSGKTTLCEALSVNSGVVFLPGGVESSWDFLADQLDRLRNDGPGDVRDTAVTAAGSIRATRAAHVILIDDLDALLSRYPVDHQLALVDRLVEILREGPTAGIFLVMTVRHISAALRTLAVLCESRLVLRLANREDHLVAGGTTAGWVPDAATGEAEWKGARVKVAQVDADRTQKYVDRVEPDYRVEPGTPVTGELLVFPVLTPVPYPAAESVSSQTIAVISTRPLEFARRVRNGSAAFRDVVQLSPSSRPGEFDSHLSPSASDRSGGITVSDLRDPLIIVGDPDTWQARYSLLASLRGESDLYFDRCSVQDYRAITGHRALPPPFTAQSENCLRSQPDGSVSRVIAPSSLSSKNQQIVNPAEGTTFRA